MLGVRRQRWVKASMRAAAAAALPQPVQQAPRRPSLGDPRRRAGELDAFRQSRSCSGLAQERCPSARRAQFQVQRRRPGHGTECIRRLGDLRAARFPEPRLDEPHEGAGGEALPDGADAIGKLRSRVACFIAAAVARASLSEPSAAPSSLSAAISSASLSLKLCFGSESSSSPPRPWRHGHGRHRNLLHTACSPERPAPASQRIPRERSRRNEVALTGACRFHQGANLAPDLKNGAGRELPQPRPQIGDGLQSEAFLPCHPAQPIAPATNPALRRVGLVAPCSVSSWPDR